MSFEVTIEDITRVVEDVTKLRVSPTSDLADLGCNSLAMLHIAAELEERYETVIPDDAIIGGGFRTPQAIFDTLRASIS